MKSKAYPYPEIVTGKKWSVFEVQPGEGARTDNLNHQMYVPMDRECIECGVNHSRYIRRHELGHVKWSPKTIGKLKPHVRQEAIEVLEEIRINHLLSYNKLGINEPVMCLSKIEQLVTSYTYQGSLSEIILLLLSIAWVKDNTADAPGHWSDEFRIAERIITDATEHNNYQFTDVRKAELYWILRKAKYFYERITTRKNSYYGRTSKVSYRKVQRLAEELSLLLEEFNDRPKPEEVVRPETDNTPTCEYMDEEGVECQADEDEDEVCSVHGDNQDEETDEASDETTQSLERRMRRDLVDEMHYASTEGIGKWGDMTIHKPPMAVNLAGRLKNSRKYRPMDYGYNPKYINRYCIDKKIFKQKQRVLGGTVLIDASGSMRFDEGDILNIMELLPAVTIAMYNGAATTGDLHIVAKNGMRVGEKYLKEWVGSGNVVDGPALRWLAEQSERRIWVSDMKVFGINRGGYADSGFNLLRDVYNICTQNRIINLKNIDEVKEHAIKLQNVV